LNEKRLSILFAGGGTGGHLYPALAIADEIRLQKPEAAITFVGTRGKIEEQNVPARGYAFASIWISGLARGVSAGTILFPLKLLVALWQSYQILRKVKPDVVVGTGGYVSGPPLFMGWLLGVPTMIQEQNSYPGLTTRLLASSVREVHLTFERSARYLPSTDNIRISGNPTRAVIGRARRLEGAQYFGIGPGRTTLLVAGGSKGATSINDGMLRLLLSLVTEGVQIVWGTGDADYGRVESAVRELEPGLRELVSIHRYINKMEYAYAVADLAVTRAGATTLAELTRAGVPSVLIPYPYATADHQTENAKALVEGGASVLCRNDEVERRLPVILKELLKDPGRRKTMSENASRLSFPHATQKLAAAVLQMAEA
jgi:UDP-N-acetylglucosamine--N-acetylmuramyl-(pentapeptide) pyrophosphoryl-undecaprenol N-acetylglucosamine transferase